MGFMRGPNPGQTIACEHWSPGLLIRTERGVPWPPPDACVFLSHRSDVEHTLKLREIRTATGGRLRGVQGESQGHGLGIYKTIVPERHTRAPARLPGYRSETCSGGKTGRRISEVVEFFQSLGRRRVQFRSTFFPVRGSNTCISC
jgi:hypothetical protein